MHFFVESLRDTLSSYVTPCPGKESEACDGYSVPFILVQNHTITDSLRVRVTGTTTIRSNASGLYLPELKDKFTGQKKKKPSGTFKAHKELVLPFFVFGSPNILFVCLYVFLKRLECFLFDLQVFKERRYWQPFAFLKKTS